LTAGCSAPRADVSAHSICSSMSSPVPFPTGAGACAGTQPPTRRAHSRLRSGGSCPQGRGRPPINPATAAGDLDHTPSNCVVQLLDVRLLVRADDDRPCDRHLALLVPVEAAHRHSRRVVRFLTMASSRSIRCRSQRSRHTRLPRMLQVSLSWWVLDCDLVTSLDWEITA